MLCVKHGLDQGDVANVQERPMDMVFAAASLLCGRTADANESVLGKPTIESHKMMAAQILLTIVRFCAGTATPEHSRRRGKARRQFNSMTPKTSS